MTLFDQFKKAFDASADKPEERAVAASDTVSVWAKAQGFTYSRLDEAKGFASKNKRKE